MTLLRLAVAGELPSPELAAQMLQGLQNQDTNPELAPKPQSSAHASTSQAPVQQANSAPLLSGVAMPVPETAPRAHGQPLVINSLEELVDTMPRSEADLKYDVRKYLRPVSFECGQISFEQTPDIPANLATRLARYLKSATGDIWLIVPTTEEKGDPSLSERRRAAEAQRRASEENHPAVKLANELFPGVTIEFRDRGPTSNVIAADFNIRDKNEDEQP